MENSIIPQKRNSMLLTARIFSSLVALFFGLAIIPKLISEHTEIVNGKPWLGNGWEGLVME